MSINYLKKNDRPVISEIYYNLGNAYSIKDNYKDAIKNFIKALKIEPNNNEIFYNLGNCQFMDKQYEEALFSYDMCDKLGGGTSQLTLMKARALIEIEGEKKEASIKKAEKILNKLIKEHGENEHVLYVFGNLMEKKGNKEKAIEYYEV